MMNLYHITLTISFLFVKTTNNHHYSDEDDDNGDNDDYDDI